MASVKPWSEWSPIDLSGSSVQCGLRPRHSTSDHLLDFTHFCREVFNHDLHPVSVGVLDFEKPT